MPWLQAHVTTDKQQVEAVEQQLEALGALSITLLDAGDQPMLEPPPGATPLWKQTEVTALFDTQWNTDELQLALNQSLHSVAYSSLRLQWLEDQAWERAWLEHFKPMRFGRHLWICPTGHQVEANDATVVRLDPGLAFGTGTHPTTRLCLEWLDGADLNGKTVIDFGCGSGILAVAALKLGAHKVIAIDHDPQALLATEENARRNQVQQRLVVVGNEQFRPVRADVVLANILANVLEDLADTIKPLVAPGGMLVLSGILERQCAEVREAYADSIQFEQPRFEEQWTLLTGQAS